MRCNHENETGSLLKTVQYTVSGSLKIILGETHYVLARAGPSLGVTVSSMHIKLLILVWVLQK